MSTSDFADRKGTLYHCRFAAHERTHTLVDQIGHVGRESRRFDCVECKRSFADYRKLTNHAKIKHDKSVRERMFTVCERCGKDISNSL